jgi:hypothetical protein
MAGLLVFLLAGVIGVGAYAFTDSNTQAENSGAGANTKAVSGYTDSPLHFTLSNGTATEAKFTAEAAAGEAEAKEAQIAVYEKGGTAVWTPCTAAAGTPVIFTCKFATALSRADVEVDTEQETIVTS